MSTQKNSPVTDLMSGLGIAPQESHPEMEDDTSDTMNNIENDLSDSDTATLMDADVSEASIETDTAKADTDTVDEKYAEMQKELEVLTKRLSDKDKYINELRNESKKAVKQEDEVLEDSYEEDSFFDDPEGKYKEMVNQLRIANLRIDEHAYASGKADYWELVNAKAIQDGFKEDPTFMQEFNTSNRPYEVAYNFLSKQKENKANTEKALRDQIRQEILAEIGGNKSKKEVPPHVNNVGKSPSGVSEAAVDGFAKVFG